MLQFSRSSYLIWDWSYGLSTKGHAPSIWTNLTLHKTIQRFKPGLRPFFHGSLSGHEIKSFTFIHHIHSIPSNVVTTSFDRIQCIRYHSFKDTFHYPNSTISSYTNQTILKQVYSQRKCNMRSKIWWLTEFCNSHYLSHFAAFFIESRAKISIAYSYILYIHQFIIITSLQHNYNKYPWDQLTG